MQTFRALTRTRMFTPGFKLFAALAGFGLLWAFLFGMSSAPEFDQLRDELATVTLGPMSLGWKGGVGDHAGYVFFVCFAAAAAFLAGVLVAFRDADPDAGAESIGAESIPLTRAPYGASYWPMAAGFTVGAMVLGLVTNMAIFWAGVVVLVAVIGVWTFRAWAERATGDDETNMAIYERFINPIRLPFTALVLIGTVAIGTSRVILAAPNKNASSFIFLGVGAALFAVFVALNFVPDLGRKIVPALIVVFAALFIGAGIVGAAKGEREMHHGTEAEGGHGSGGAEGTEGSGTEGTGTKGETEGETPTTAGSGEEGLAPAPAIVGAPS